MGVLTTAYSIPSNLMRKIRTDNDNLAYVVGECENDEIWKLESYDFDTSIEVIISILREAGCEKTAKQIDSEYADLDIFDYSPYDIWTISPSQVKTMLKELENVNIAELQAKGNVNEITDRRGNLLSESLYESYVDDLKGIRKFIKKTVEQENYLLFTEA